MDMRGKSFSVTLVSGQPIGLAESGEILVPVKFPCDFFIAERLGIKVIETAPVNERGSFTGDGFQMPVDRMSEAQIAKRQKVKATLSYSISPLKDVPFLFRPAPSELRR